MKTIAIVIFLFFNLYFCSAQESPFPGKKHFVHDAISREYLLYMPHQLADNAPLIVILHGYSSSAEKIMSYSGMNQLAEDFGFALVYPQGTFDADSNRFWNVGYSFHQEIKVNDVDFLAMLVDSLQREYSLSNENSFITGMSNGGEMCYLMACKYPELFKAFAPVAGMMMDHFFDCCNSTVPVSLFAIFGTNDRVTNFNGDALNKDGWGAYKSIPFAIDFWKERLRDPVCETKILENKNQNDGSYIVIEDCMDTISQKEILFYKVENGDHDWPGAWGNMDIDASLDILNFFQSKIE
jgi:polyhydroxybutyrate depolymerase